MSKARMTKERLDKLREQYCGQISLDFHTRALIEEIDELMKEKDAIQKMLNLAGYSLAKYAPNGLKALVEEKNKLKGELMHLRGFGIDK